MNTIINVFFQILDQLQHFPVQSGHMSFTQMAVMALENLIRRSMFFVIEQNTMFFFLI